MENVKVSLIPVLDLNHLQNEAVANRLTRQVNVYRGTAEDNLKMERPALHYNQQITVTSKAWKNTDKRVNLHNRIHSLRQQIETMKNASQGVDQSVISQLIGAYYIDIIRLSDEMPDYTGVLTQVIDRPDLPKDINLRDYLPYTGKEREMAGSNDSVPLIEEHTAVTKLVTLTLKGFGHKNSLWDLLFNPFWDIERLMQTAATIRVDSRNDNVIGEIVRGNYNANHTQAADTTGATRDLKIYNTILGGITKVKGLYHPLFTNRKIGSIKPKIYLLLNPTDEWSVQRVVSGALVGASGVAQIVSALPIDGIISYGGGIQDGLPWGKEILSYPGVPEGSFFIVAVNPFGGFTFVKRDLTLETGPGEVLQLSTEERAWYRVGTTFLEWLIGKNDNGKEVGAIIKGSLPN